MDRGNHYESAFEAYLQNNKICYVAVDEQRRSCLAGEPVKSLDFIIYAESGARFVVDVKGRKFPGGPPEKPKKVWECWSTIDDVEGLERWAGMSGPGYQGLLVFIYDIAPEVNFPENTEDFWTCRDKRYLARAVLISDYRTQMRPRSQSWRTVDLPGKTFRAMVRPLRYFLELPDGGEDFDMDW